MNTPVDTANRLARLWLLLRSLSIELDARLETVKVLLEDRDVLTDQQFNQLMRETIARWEADNVLTLQFTTDPELQAILLKTFTGTQQ